MGIRSGGCFGLSARERILLLIGQHLCNAPRPQKEALALMDAGYDVTIAGCWHDDVFAERDQQLIQQHNYRFQPYLDMRPTKTAARFSARLKSKASRIFWRKLKRFSSGLLGYGARDMLGFARRFRADLTIGHCEGSLWACERLHQSGQRVGVDFEDWFSRDLLPEARADRPIEELDRLECAIARESVYHVTTSDVLANAMAVAHGTTPAATVYNVFPAQDAVATDGGRRDRLTEDHPSLHWFSQTTGPGRGLEEVCDAVAQVKEPLELHFRGRCEPEYEASLRQRLREDQREFFRVHDTVPNAELTSRIAEHDIGLAMEQPYCASRDLTITNKFFQYLQGGLAVIATETGGQCEGVAKAECGLLVKPSSQADLVAALRQLLGERERLILERAASKRAAERLFNWERMAPIVVENVERALAGRDS